MIHDCPQEDTIIVQFQIAQSWTLTPHELAIPDAALIPRDDSQRNFNSEECVAWNNSMIGDS
jgi:hypothetical protein